MFFFLNNETNSSRKEKKAEVDTATYIESDGLPQNPTAHSSGTRHCCLPQSFPLCTIVLYV